MSVDAYWDQVDAELAAVPMAAELREIPERATPDSTLYLVRLTSIGPYRVTGVLQRAQAAGAVSGFVVDAALRERQSRAGLSRSRAVRGVADAASRPATGG